MYELHTPSPALPAGQVDKQDTSGSEREFECELDE